MIRKYKPREITEHLIELCDLGFYDYKQILNACLSYMSEDEVAEMVRINDLFNIYERDDFRIY